MTLKIRGDPYLRKRAEKGKKTGISSELRNYRWPKTELRNCWC